MKQLLWTLALLLPLSAMAQHANIRRNQVGCYPQQEKQKEYGRPSLHCHRRHAMLSTSVT